MKELDLMYAMDAVEDDLLLEAENYTLPRRKISWVRVVAVAAVVALLAFTVDASYAEARISYPKEENSSIFQDFEYEGVVYSSYCIEYDLQPVEIREHAEWFLTDMVDMVSHWLLEDGDLIAYGHGLYHEFASLKIAEDFFGLTFDLPDIVREGEIPNRDVSLIAVPMYCSEDLTPDEALNYEPDLGGAELQFSVHADDKRIDIVAVNIYLGLTEEFTAVPATHNRFGALDLLGEPEIQEIRVGDEEFTVLTYADDPAGSVQVYYVRDGIGYGLHFYPKEDYNGDALRLIHSHLKDISG